MNRNKIQSTEKPQRIYPHAGAVCSESCKHGFEWECQGAIPGSTPNCILMQIMMAITKGHQTNLCRYHRVLKIGAIRVGIITLSNLRLNIAILSISTMLTFGRQKNSISQN